MAENKRSANYFTASLEENSKIDEHFAGLMHYVFDGLYNSMGKKNFLRWIDKRNISGRIKELIVEEFQKQDIEEHPRWAGYYTQGTNRERLKSGFINENVARHETLHFLTDGYYNGANFPTFIDEGITEYLNREIEKSITNNPNVGYSYKVNVDFVEFLHNIIGDTLIKNYLKGSSKAFEEEFSTYMTEDGLANVGELRKFYNSLDRVHSMLYSSKIPQTSEEKNRKENIEKYITEFDYSFLRSSIANMVVNSIRKKAKNLEYYEDGILNLEQSIDDIELLTKKTLKILEKNQSFGITKSYGKEKLKLEERILRNSLKAVLEESHIPNEKVESIINECVSKPSTYGDKSIYTESAKIKKVELQNLIENFNTSNTAKQLIDKRMKNTENYMNEGIFNITSFLMDASLILDKMNLNGEQRNLYLDSAILSYLPKDVNLKMVKNLVDKDYKLYSALSRKEKENARKITESRFVKISDSKFIEKRDNKIYFLNYDEKTGNFLENEIVGEQIDSKMRFSKEMVDKYGETIKQMTYVDRNEIQTNVFRIVLNENFSKVSVNDKEYAVLPNINELANTFLVEEAMRDISDGIKNNKYVSILKDEQEVQEGVMYTMVVPDKRSRIINYETFFGDLKNSINNLPKELRKDIEQEALSYLICKTYLAKPEDIGELQAFMQNFSCEAIHDENSIQKLYNYTEKLNEIRKNEIREKEKYNAICFKTDEARYRWKESMKVRDEYKKIKELNQDIISFVNIEAISCVKKPLSVETNEEHWSTIDGVVYQPKQKVEYRSPLASSVDYDLFCKELGETLKSVTEDKKSKFLSGVIYKSIDMWYGYGKGYPKDDIINDEREDLTAELYELLCNKVMKNEEIDVLKIHDIEEKLLTLSQEEKNICKEILEKRKPIRFETLDVQRKYENIESIQKIENFPEENKKTLIQEIKEKNTKELNRKRKMDAFARLALSKDNIPSKEDINKASRIINFNTDISRD